jgi:hypothetical protein
MDIQVNQQLAMSADVIVEEETALEERVWM